MFCFFTLKIENTKGEVFELTHNTKDYVVAGIQGLTRPPTSVNTSACAGIDGSFGLDYPFQVGDEITINTLSGELSVTLHRGGSVTNLLRYLSGDSTWIKLGSGSNYLTFSADPNSDLVYAVFRTAILYGGV